MRRRGATPRDRVDVGARLEEALAVGCWEPLDGLLTELERDEMADGQASTTASVSTRALLVTAVG
ncbi:MAG: hypothetical protein ABIQ15_09620 [Nocardioides sp.]